MLLEEPSRTRRCRHNTGIVNSLPPRGAPPESWIAGLKTINLQRAISPIRRYEMLKPDPRT
jgi:hypothetical protein